jgi:asparagine synthase (glutamine-hydrolysing)
MPGIFGILDLTGKIDSKGKIQAMATSSEREPWFKTYTFVQGKIALGVANLGAINPVPQPVFNKDRSLCIVMHGEIYDYRANLRKLIRKEESDLMNILVLSQKKPLDFIPDLNGSFVYAIWDFKRKRLTIANDRYGLRPLYYSFNNYLFIFASEIKALLPFSQVPKQIDERSIAEFFSFEFVLGDKTFFESIKVLPPASILTLEHNQLTMEQYWKPSFNDQDSFAVKEEDLEKMEKVICEAVGRQIEPSESVGLFLSGGLDSRTILAAANRKGHSIPTYTFGEKGCEDERIAKQVAQTLNCPNYFFQLSPDYLKEWARKGVWSTEGMNNCLNFHGVEILPRVRQKSRIMLYGLEGNTWLGFLSLSLLEFLFLKDENKFIRRFFHKLNSPFPEEVQTRLFQKEFHRRVRGLAFQSLKESLKLIDYQANLNKVYHFLVTEKDRRLTILGAIVDHDFVDYRLPFYDYDFVDFAQSIPPKQRTLARFYRRFITKRFPEVARIPYQRTGLPVSSGTLKVLVKRAREISFEKLKYKVLRSNVRPLRSYGNTDDWLRHQLKDFLIETLLNRKALSREYLNPSFIEDILRQHLSGKQNLSRQIGLLLTFELWHQLYLD